MASCRQGIFLVGESQEGWTGTRSCACLRRPKVSDLSIYAPRAILILLITYGLRAGEVAGLRLDDLNWADERCRHPVSTAFANTRD